MFLVHTYYRVCIRTVFEQFYEKPDQGIRQNVDELELGKVELEMAAAVG